MCGSVGHDPSDLDGADLLVASPGVPPSAEVFAWATRARGARVWGSWSSAPGSRRRPYLAVTGTNGKTTATGMLAACLRAAGIDADRVRQHRASRSRRRRARAYEALVVEVSSFQLELQTSVPPAVSVLLNLAPDHLDHHGSFDAYRTAKAAIYARQTGAGRPRRQPRRCGRGRRLGGGAVPRPLVPRRGRPGSGEVGYERDELVARDRSSARSGSGRSTPGAPGYREDAAAAAAAALAFGVEPEADRRRASRRSRPPAHRGEVVAEIDGVRFIDNSKATNVHAALAAIAEVRRRGADRRRPCEGAGPRAAAGRAPATCVAVVALGEASAEIETVFAGRRRRRRRRHRSRTPCGAAFALATRPGVVLLAPALRELGSVRVLRRARRPVRRRRARAGGARGTRMAERSQAARRTAAKTSSAPARKTAPPRRRTGARGERTRHLRVLSPPRRRTAAEAKRLARHDLALLGAAAGFLTVVGLVDGVVGGLGLGRAGLRREQLLVLRAPGRSTRCRGRCRRARARGCSPRVWKALGSPAARRRDGADADRGPPVVGHLPVRRVAMDRPRPDHAAALGVREARARRRRRDDPHQQMEPARTSRCSSLFPLGADRRCGRRCSGSRSETWAPR